MNMKKGKYKYIKEKVSTDDMYSAFYKKTEATEYKEKSHENKRALSNKECRKKRSISKKIISMLWFFINLIILTYVIVFFNYRTLITYSILIDGIDANDVFLLIQFLILSVIMWFWYGMYFRKALFFLFTLVTVLLIIFFFYSLYSTGGSLNTTMSTLLCLFFWFSLLCSDCPVCRSYNYDITNTSDGGSYEYTTTEYTESTQWEVTRTYSVTIYHHQCMNCNHIWSTRH